MVLGLGVRGYYIHVHTQHPVVRSDVFYYHGGANLLAEGHGFVQPYYFVAEGRSVPGADHPPGYIVALAVASVFGFKSFFAHQVWSALSLLVQFPLAIPRSPSNQQIRYH